MTISSFCRAELLAHGPLSLHDLAGRAVAAGVTRARNPLTSVSQAVRDTEQQLLDGRWVTPMRLLEGRCLTAAALPRPRSWGWGLEPDLELLGADASRFPAPEDLAPGTLLCVRVEHGEAHVSTIPEPGAEGVAALAERIRLLTPRSRYGDEARMAVRAVAQLMVDDPTTFRTPLPPLSTWVPALVEAARRAEQQRQHQEAWEREQSRQLRLCLDDCQAIEVSLAAERAGLSDEEWVLEAIDAAVTRSHAHLRAAGGGSAVVVPLHDRR